LKKLKLYLDTSIISYLDQQDTPDKMNDTLAFWEDVTNGKYDIVLSNVTLNELNQSNDEKKLIFKKFLDKINFDTFEETEETKILAEEYIKHGVLSNKSIDDCNHIACAVVSNCDVIVSWNFKHIVNYKTIKGVKVVNAINEYKEIAIYPPTMLIEE